MTEYQFKNKNINKRGLTFTIISTVLVLIVLGTLLRRNFITSPLDDLDIKSGPNISYETIGKVNRGNHIEVIKHKNNWVKIVFQNKKTGWIPAWLLNNKANLKKSSKLAESTIVLDPGHGGSDSGALSTKNKKEKTYTLQIAKQTAKKLRATGANIIMTRDSDKTVSLFKRPSFSTANNANLFLSYHFDSSDNDNSASGFTSYYYHANKSKQLATDINHSLNNLPMDNRGIQFGDYLVIRDVKVPSALLEMGYINDDDDFKHIANPEFQQKTANDVTKGIHKYINETY